MPRTKSFGVSVELTVLEWLIGSSGWTREEIAKRLKTSTRNIEKIESGEKKPSFRQLEELSIIFKRPVASFLLSKPLAEKPKPKDYRLIPGKTNRFDKKTLLVIRKTRMLQALSGELSRNIQYETKPKLEKSIDNPEHAARAYREIFSLTEEKQRRFNSPYQLFNYLRDAFEDLNIFIFQFSMPLEDARGFVFADEQPAVIVVNTKDRIEARLFSLMHEFAHILLGESVIDLPDATRLYGNNTERWCNKFASAFLLPKELAIATFEAHKYSLSQTETLRTLSHRFKVSKAMLLLNMLKLKYIGKKDYDEILARFKIESVKGKASAESGIPSEIMCLSKVGNKFVSLVANNFDRDFITYNDALNYLSIKSKSFDKVLSKAKK